MDGRVFLNRFCFDYDFSLHKDVCTEITYYPSLIDNRDIHFFLRL